MFGHCIAWSRIHVAIKLFYIYIWLIMEYQTTYLHITEPACTFSSVPTLKYAKRPPGLALAQFQLLFSCDYAQQEEDVISRAPVLLMRPGIGRNWSSTLGKDNW